MLLSSLSPKRRRSTPKFRAGDLVTFDGRKGRVLWFGISPYYDEEIKGIQRAYVEPVDNSWQGTQYWPVVDGLEAR